MRSPGVDGRRTHPVREVQVGLRPTHQYVEASGSEGLVMRTVYGESLANAEVLNLRGQAYRVYDGAGVQTAVAYDFKGGLLAAERQLAVDVTQTLDWSALGELEDVTVSGRIDVVGGSNFDVV